MELNFLMNNWNKCYITYKDKKYDLGKIEEMFNLNVLNTNVFDAKLKDINNLKNIILCLMIVLH